MQVKTNVELYVDTEATSEFTTIFKIQEGKYFKVKLGKFKSQKVYPTINLANKIKTNLWLRIYMRMSDKEKANLLRTIEANKIKKRQ